MSNQGLSVSAPSPRPGSEQPTSYPCICRKGDGTGDYIECDNPTCNIGWYHWECVNVTEEIEGGWLCPTCSPSASYYNKQLIRALAPSKPASNDAKTPGPAASKGKSHLQGNRVSAFAPQAKKAAYSARSKGTEAKKGLAAKKAAPAPAKPKPRWRGWVEMTSDGEEEFKKQVNSQWQVEDVSGRRRGASKASEDTRTASSNLRPRLRAGKKIVIESDSDDEESFGDVKTGEVEEEEEEKDESENDEALLAPVRRRASARRVLPNDSDESDGSMDVDQSSEDAESDSSDDKSNGDSAADHEAEDSEDSMNMEVAEDAVEVDDSEPELENIMDVDDGEPFEGSGSVDGGDASESSYRTAPESSRGREIADSQSPQPEPAAASPVLEPSRPVVRREPRMSIGFLLDAPARPAPVTAALVAPAVAAPVTAAPAVPKFHPWESGSWGEYPESAIRSTLPRLG